jgi:hypothetical protein
MPTSNTGVSLLQDISCASATRCAAVDTGDAGTCDGTAWTSDDISVKWLDSVSCPAVDLRETASSVGQAWEFNGSTWREIDGIDNAASGVWLSCASMTLCAAIDGNGEAFVKRNPGPTSP